jgi:hypothetical protein
VATAEAESQVCKSYDGLQRALQRTEDEIAAAQQKLRQARASRLAALENGDDVTVVELAMHEAVVVEQGLQNRKQDLQRLLLEKRGSWIDCRHAALNATTEKIAAEIEERRKAAVADLGGLAAIEQLFVAESERQHLANSNYSIFAGLKH